MRPDNELSEYLAAARGRMEGRNVNASHLPLPQPPATLRGVLAKA